MLTIARIIFLVLVKGPIIGSTGIFGLPEKESSISFSEANSQFCLSLRYNADNSYLFVNRKEIKFKFNVDNKNVNFLTQFCIGSIYIGFSASESREVSLNENVYDFSFDFSSIHK